MSDAPISGAGAILLVRHGEPALSRKVWLTAEGYRQWWARYELGGLKAGQTPPGSLIAQAQMPGTRLISSGLLRSVETADAVARGQPYDIDPVYVEAPLPPPATPGWFKLPPRFWGVLARVTWWFFDHHQGQESRRQAEARASLAADRLEAMTRDGATALVLAHGFFNTMVGRELIARGWKCTQDQGYNYWCIRRFERSGG